VQGKTQSVYTQKVKNIVRFEIKAQKIGVLCVNLAPLRLFLFNYFCLAIFFTMYLVVLFCSEVLSRASHAVSPSGMSVNPEKAYWFNKLQNNTETCQ